MNTDLRTADRLRIAALTLAFACPAAALAGAVTDGSVGAVQTLSGRFEVPQTLGSVKGGNLFHSFASFGVASGESATFTTSSAAIQNVITRVTGGTPSAIYGPLTLQAAAGSRPDFFFINPAGVLFGAGAQIDVPGGFHVSTAQQLKFADGFVWDTGSPTVSGLTVAAPEAFGFLGRSSPALVGFTNLDADGVAGDSPSINLPAYSALTVAGGMVVFDGTSLELPAVLAHIAATGAAAADVPLALSIDELDRPLGGLILLSNSYLTVGSPGILVLRGDSIALLQSRVAVNSVGLPSDTGPGAVIIRAADALVLQNGQVQSTTTCDAPGSLISIEAGRLAADGPASVIDTVTNGGKGDAGAIDIDVKGAMTLGGGAAIFSMTTNSGGDAGPVSVKADSLRIDGNESSKGIASLTNYGAGHAGNVSVDVTNDLTLANGGTIASLSTDGGDAGEVLIRAKTLDISSNPYGATSGILVGANNSVLRNNSAGSIDIDVKGAMTVTGNAYVGSGSKLSSGHAGDVAIRTVTLSADGAGSAISTFTDGGTADAGAIDIDVKGAMTLGDGASIISRTTNSGGNAGPVSVKADSLRIDGNGGRGGIASNTESSIGQAGRVSVDVTNDLTLINGGYILSSSLDGGDAGKVVVKAKTLDISRQPDGPATGISVAVANSVLRNNSAGSISIDVAGAMTVTGGAYVGTGSDHSSGRAGEVTIRTGSLRMEGDGVSLAAIDSRAKNGTADAGSIAITVAGDMTMTRGGTINSSTSSGGKGGNINIAVGNTMRMSEDCAIHSDVTSSASDAGAIDVSVGGAMIMRDGATVSTSSHSATGNAGALSIRADSLTIIDGRSDDALSRVDSSTVDGTGHGGRIDINVKKTLALANRGAIGSLAINSGKGGDGGDIFIKAEQLSVAGGPNSTSAITNDAIDGKGNAGHISIEADRVLITRGGAIDTSTHSVGAGGSVVLTIGTMMIDAGGSTGKTGIASEARAAGNAGSVKINATGEVTLRNGAVVVSDTQGTGAAGTVDVNVGRLTVDGVVASAGSQTGIFSSASAGSSGQTGEVKVHADNGISLRNGGTLSIRNDATVADPKALAPTTLNVSATDILLDHAEITAEATGNANAGHIDIAAGNRLTLRSSSVRTSAVDGDGGSIRLAGKLIRLNDSLVTTSVEGQTNGNGGNIDISGNALVLKSGFIQANTQAPLARGGNININTRLLIPEGGRLVLGGARVPFGSGYSGLNVIQAAAPDGIAGDLQVTTPELNLAGTLSGLSSPVVDFGPLARDQCRVGGGSSFTLTGSGIAPTSIADLAEVAR
jgi:filamentous hemagglutinin family protein